MIQKNKKKHSTHIEKHIPTTGSKTACVACSSPIGVLNQIRFNLLAIGESSVEATVRNYG